jgi:hypothetical protein
MKLGFSGQSFQKYSITKVYENPSIESRVVSFGWTDGRTDMTMPIVAFRNFANLPKIF